MADEKLPVAPGKPDFNLIVVHPFGDYARGKQITDAAEIAAVMAGENAHFCRKTFPQ
ncbi:hypothetical protein [Pararobbsia alpina]|uniref:Uncharacterized protein n=1 Tax=Pararobbsia alpina TaxID=621374 RepID=A0A6S7B3K5_9BURK|nr:hypothetical protein [Pararobbsia alpina]CAB3784337.1 hypothetical protein LMG28138_01789 [Pararobbsia alpina]